MSQPTQELLKEFVQWSTQAYALHAANEGRTALMQARLSAEGMARIAVYHAWPEARAREAVTDRSFQDLLVLIQRNALVSAQMLTALHVLRVHGNNATHGEPISPADVELGMAALRSATALLYGELLRLPVPVPLALAMRDADPLRRLEQERDGIARQLAEERLRDAAVREQGIAQRQEHDAMIAQGETRLRSIEERLEEQLRINEELRLAAIPVLPPEPALVGTVPEIAPETPARSRRAWSLAGIVLAVLVPLVLWWAWAGTDSGAEVESQPVSSQEFRVLLLPFAVLQDDPNVRINIPAALRKRLEDRAPHLPLATHVLMDTTALATTYSEEEAVALARKHRARVVLFGELYEPTATDSGRIELRYADTTHAKPFSGTMGLRAFRTLSDSAAIRILMAANTIVEVGMANVLFDRDRYSEVLAMLHTTPVVTRDGLTTIQLHLAHAYFQLGDHARALHEVDDVLAREPDHAHALAGKGHMLVGMGEQAAAIPYFQRSIAIEPRKVGVIIALVNIVADDNDPELFDPVLTKELVAQAYRVDSTRADVWDVLGLIAQSEDRIAEAQRCFERALEMDPSYLGAMHHLAHLLATQNEAMDLARAERLLREELRQDSSRTRAALLLAQVLNQQRREPELAERLFRRSKQEDPAMRLSALRGEAKSAATQGRMDAAIALYEEALTLDPTDLVTAMGLAQAYKQQGHYARMHELMQDMLAYDSLGHVLNLNLGTFYRNAPAPWADLAKAEFHLRRALRTDPYDLLNLAELAAVLMARDQPGEAIALCDRVLAQQPGHFNCNAFLGRAWHQRGQPVQAQAYFERALRERPKDPIVLAGLAGVLVDLGPPYRARALALLEQAVAATPAQGILHYNIASFHLHFGDMSKAASSYRQAISLDPTLEDRAMEDRLRKAGF